MARSKLSVRDILVGVMIAIGVVIVGACSVLTPILIIDWK
jgi:hypothetical protein